MSQSTGRTWEGRSRLKDVVKTILVATALRDFSSGAKAEAAETSSQGIRCMAYLKSQIARRQRVQIRPKGRLCGDGWATSWTFASHARSEPDVCFMEPETGCEVVLLGCLHGSKSSARDVSKAIEEPGVAKTRVVVLELCASRFVDMKREIGALPGSSLFTEWPRRWWQLVSLTVERKGVATGISTAVLGVASGLQAALGGFQPGLEFVTALESARKIDRCDVILADAAVEETLDKLGALPRISLHMLARYFSTGFNWQDTYAADANHLNSAIWGDSDYFPHQLDMGKVLSRAGDVRRDILRLTLPPILLAEAAWSVLELLLGGDELAVASPGGEVLDSLQVLPPDATPLAWMAAQLSPEFCLQVFEDLLTLFMSYVLLVLPATRIILSERDDQLATGIRAACRLASTKKVVNTEGVHRGVYSEGRVVAVLGLLHVNGVARRLRKHGFDPRK